MSGSASTKSRRPRRGRGRAGVLVVLALALLVAAGVGYALLQDPGPDGDAPTATGTPTPLSDLDVSDRRVPRGPFCVALEQDGIEAALGGPVTRTGHYDSGDRASLATGLTDIAHEYNCGYYTA